MVFLPFHKLADVYLQPAAYGAKGQAKGSRGLAFAFACIHVGVALSLQSCFWHVRYGYDCTIYLLGFVVLSTNLACSRLRN